MKNLKTIIIIVFVIIIVLITVLLIILKQSPQNERPDEYDNTLEDSGLYQFDKTIQPVSIRNNFYAVKACVEKFYLTCSNLNNDTNSNFMIEGEALELIQEEQKENINAIYNMLDEEYIRYANITQENLSSKIDDKGEVSIQIDKMYVSEQSANTAIYFVYGNLMENSSGKNTNFSMILKLDMLHKTFKLFLQDYVEANYANIDFMIGKDLNISMEEEISNDINNIFEYQNISDERYITDIFDSYKIQLLYNRTKAYQLLNAQYANAKFETQQNFENYIQENISRIATLTLSQYQKTVENNITQYVCIDQNGNYYIFQETAPMQYTVMLDTYTIDLPEFVEQYENSTDEQKVLWNIQKFFDAINQADYKYAYNKLDETFRANNFSTQLEFENYVKTNFFTQNELTARNPQKQNDIYLYDITIQDKTGTNQNSITKTFVMQLKEGTDFVMSFSV